MDAYTRPDFPRSALLTIDLQHDFLSDSPHGVAGTTEILPAVERLVRAFRAAQRPIVHVVRLYLPDGSNADLCRKAVIAAGTRIVAPDSHGCRLADALLSEHAPPLDPEMLLSGAMQPLGPNEHVLYKPRWSAFYRTNLGEYLRDREVNTVVVAGCNSPNCPRATLVDATERDLRAVAVSDSLSQWSDTAATELGGIGVEVRNTPDVVEQIAGLAVPT